MSLESPSSPDPVPWRVLSSQPGPEMPLFRVRFDQVVNPRNSVERRAVVLESPHWCSVVALTAHEAFGPRAPIQVWDGQSDVGDTRRVGDGGREPPASGPKGASGGDGVYVVRLGVPGRPRTQPGRAQQPRPPLAGPGMHSDPRPPTPAKARTSESRPCPWSASRRRSWKERSGAHWSLPRCPES